MPVRLAIGILLIVLVSLGIFKLLMSPPSNELALMALFLSITAFVSALAGYAAYRFGWIRLSPTLRWTLLGGYALASILTFFNVWFSAQLMFASSHDLTLAIILLLFASGIAMILGYFLSTTVTERILSLKDAAESIATGNLETRVPVSGRDELSALAVSFNQMANNCRPPTRSSGSWTSCGVTWLPGPVMICKRRSPRCAPSSRRCQMEWWMSRKW